MSKFLIVSSKPDGAEKIEKAFSKILNFAQIYEEDQKVIFRSFFRTKKLTTFRTFNNSKHENLSQIFFPDKAKDLEGFPIKIILTNRDLEDMKRKEIYNPWRDYLSAIAQALNATLSVKITFIEYDPKTPSTTDYTRELYERCKQLSYEDKLDLQPQVFVSPMRVLSKYFYEKNCWNVPLPPKYTIYEQVLFLPLDSSCWIFLGITTAMSAVLWRLLEGPGSQWNFLFGIYSLFVGQYAEVRA